MEREPHGITQQIQSFGFLAIVGTVSALYIWESQFWSWIAVGSVSASWSCIWCRERHSVER